MNPPVCPACGARLAPGATQCDLCGHVLGDEQVAERDRVVPESVAAVPDAPVEASEEPAPATPTPAAPVAPGAEDASGSFCIHCGAKNPGYARFCYNCGQALHGAEAAPVSGRPDAVPVVATTPVVPAPTPTVPADAVAATGERPDSDAGKRALTLVGAGVLAVLVLFFITRMSQNDPPPPAANPGAAQTAPQAVPDQLSDDALARAASLEEEIEAATSDEERLAKQEALAGLYTQEGAFSRAAVVQEEIAESLKTALAWADAGSLYLAHMLRTSGADRATYAQLAAEAYEQSLAIDSTDLDVKTDLATAYLNDQQNPMQAVATVKEVLTTDPNHVRANFNYGLMLAQINRVDQAIEQFQKVIGLTEHDDPVHQRAEQELTRMQSGQGGTASG
ncbi:MAG: zinc-ribbon domain-containing protein [Rhodothermales bacterium]